MSDPKEPAKESSAPSNAPSLPPFASSIALPSWITSLTPFGNPTTTNDTSSSAQSHSEAAQSNSYTTTDLIPNTLIGHVERDAVSEYTFRSQERTFRTKGFALDPSITNTPAGSTQGLIGKRGTARTTSEERAVEKQLRNDVKRQRLPTGDPGVLDGDNAYKGPWAGYRGETLGKPTGPPQTEVQAGPTGSEKGKAEDKAIARKFIQPGEERTIFHGKQERDYQGRTYMHVPRDVGNVNLYGEPGSQECFIPKRLVHTWSGHKKGVAAIRFIPNSGHLLLSAGLDGKVKLWDVYHNRQGLRTFLGHNKGVRDICFSNDGRRFLSCSYDKYIKLWDTETGQCLKSFTTGKMPYCVKFHPDDDQQNIFLAGFADKKINQFDVDTGEIVQEYNQHLGAVNSITFVDDNRRFVSTSDDKTMRVWEFGIPIVIRLIAESSMHSIPSVTPSPNRKWLACQSLDNQILIYSAGEKLRINNKKRFTGHLVAGYACQPNFSADGRFVMSGDADGRLWFWDWKTCKPLEKFQAHDDVVIGCQWHPHETSKVATCSWDGKIKYWD
ncbi:hypothetical protein IWQ62_000372 [Dispira parvispora]|uniref:Pre-mRNA-processing factor 17 n=1 Tax=Dispira parvispora TaxID=1520584 RepID=A0A9W8AUW1_9FUNG|nr:hypothetical protein IWQ62_000372 [Dispira parvispora]